MEAEIYIWTLYLYYPYVNAIFVANTLGLRNNETKASWLSITYIVFIDLLLMYHNKWHKYKAAFYGAIIIHLATFRKHTNLALLVNFRCFYT